MTFMDMIAKGKTLCDECQGEGCDTCDGLGYKETHDEKRPKERKASLTEYFQMRRNVKAFMKTSGWWKTTHGVCGDGPADLVGDYLDAHPDTTREAVLVLLQDFASDDLGGDVADLWMSEWKRNPTQEELEDLVDFCTPGMEGGGFEFLPPQVPNTNFLPLANVKCEDCGLEPQAGKKFCAVCEDVRNEERIAAPEPLINQDRQDQICVLQYIRKTLKKLEAEPETPANSKKYQQLDADRHTLESPITDTAQRDLVYQLIQDYLPDASA